MRESVFSKLYYEILLRLNFSSYTQPIFKCFEASFWFINLHLKNIELNFFGTVKVLPERRVVGAEALIHIYSCAKNKEVMSLSKKLIFDILKAELSTGKHLSEVATEDIILPCRDIIDREYADLAVNLERISVITNCFNLIKEVILFIGGGNENVSAQKILAIGGTTGPYELTGESNQVKILIENNTPNTKYKNFELDVSEYSTLRQLKNKILELFVCFTDRDVFMMSKGRILYELDKTLKELAFMNGQKILLFQNEDFERDAEGEMIKAKESKIELVKEILPDLSNELISLALTRNGDDVTLTIAFLSEGSGEFLAEELKEIDAKKAELGKPGGNAVNDIEKKAEIKSFMNFLSEFNELYVLIFRLMRLGNTALDEILWDLLLVLPLSSRTKQQIRAQTEGGQMNIEINNESDFEAFDLVAILTTPNLSQSCYALHVLSKIIKDDASNTFLEWLLFEGNLLLLVGAYQGEEAGLIVSGQESTSKEYQTRLRFVSTLLEVMKAINTKFANPPSLKVKLLHNESIYGLLLKECESEANTNINDSERHDLFEMYAQAIQESKFDVKILSLFKDILSRGKQLDERELTLVHNIFSFCIEFNEKSKSPQILSTIVDLVCTHIGSLGPNSTSLTNLVLYYACLFNTELDLVNLVRHSFPAINNIDGLQDTIGCLSSVKFRIEILAQLIGILERNKLKTQISSTELKLMLVSLTKQMRGLFEDLSGKGRITEAMWLAAQSQKNPEAHQELIFFEKCKFVANELFLLQKQCLKFISSITSKVTNDEELKDLYENFFCKILLNIFDDQKCFVSLMALQPESRIRSNLFDIILIFAGDNVDSSLELLLKLSTLYKDDDFKTNAWNYVDVRKPSSYIGIKNLGSTCYANSLLQQLYHNERIREFVLGLNTSEVGVISQIQQLFLQLDKGMLSQADLMPFTQVFTGFEGQPINVRVQQDVNEFYNLLMDIIEMELKEQGYKGQDKFHQEMGGKLHNEISSLEKDYEYEACNEEHYNTLSLDVKGTGGINEALEKYFKTEIFDDDNKLLCEKYNKKIKAKKNTWLSRHLPQTLTVMLKRFEYDMKTWTRSKLNDYFEFPLELNLGKWVKLPDEEGLSLIDEPMKYTYKLKGVLVHSGTAEFGHYYSFILVDGKWIEFNDTKVAEFDPNQENIKKEWFGADADGGGLFPFTQTSKSAYMLFYEKVAQAETSKPTETMDIEKTEGDDLAQVNTNFLRVKAYNDLATLRFMNELLTKLDNEEGIDRLLHILVEKIEAIPALENNVGMDQEPCEVKGEDEAVEKMKHEEVEISDKINKKSTENQVNTEQEPDKVEEEVLKGNAEEPLSNPSYINQAIPGDNDDNLEMNSGSNEKICKAIQTDRIKEGEGERLYAFLKNLKVN